MTLTLYPEDFVVCQLPASEPVLPSMFEGRFASVSKTEDELSVVCDERFAPASAKVDKGWRAFKLHGPFAFDEIGIVASLAVPLAEAEVGIFVISTFDTDYLLVKTDQLYTVLLVLRDKGHSILEAEA